MHRVWLNWNTPCLPAAAEWLIHRRLAGGQCDLRDTICVTPGRRAGRILLELLLRQSRQRQVRLTPPQTVTPGTLAGELLTTAGPAATEGESILAWIGAIQQCPPDFVRALIPAAPADADLHYWRDLACTAASLHDELAGWSIDFADVADAADRREMFAEGDRWRALAAIAQRYHDQLEQAGLVDRQKAQATQLDEGLFAQQREVVLIGVTEMNTRQRALLEALGDQCTALVHAPEQLAGRFDDCGCIVPEAWQDPNVDLRDDQVIAADRPSDQAQAAMRVIADLESARGPEEITIGLGDDGLADTMARAAQWAGLNAHDVLGAPLPRTAPCRLLSSVADWLEEPRFECFAALLRHPDIEDALQETLADGDKVRATASVRDGEDMAEDGESNAWGNVGGNVGGGAGGVVDWLSLLDRYFAAHLHQRIAGHWLGDPERASRLRAVYQAVVAGMLEPLAAAARPLGEWTGPILQVLEAIYASSDKRRVSSPTLDACGVLRDKLASWNRVPPGLQPVVTAAAALRLLLADVSDTSLPSPVREDQVEMLGWLELHLDTAPVLIITGFNDGSIPRAVAGDPFLPDSLRSALGITCNQRRYARDAYLMQAINHSRPAVTVIAGRRSADDEPLAPSRMLLACDDETLLRRVELLCGDVPENRPPLPIGAACFGADDRLGVPDLPGHVTSPRSMSVTDFRLYLACPYRFALSRLLRLGLSDDDSRELDPLDFGDLAHRVLQAFGENEGIRDSDDPAAISKYLVGELRNTAATKFGPEPMPAVRVQLARLEHRLEVFSQHQAEVRNDGWRIKHAEFNLELRNDNGEVEKETLLTIPEQDPMPVRGRIDRIDRHESDGRLRIIDYKTGDSGTTPFQTHHHRSGKKLPEDALTWFDLQLPLYHHLAKQRGITGEVELAYIVLPRRDDDAGLKLAGWKEHHLEAAIDKAREVVIDIRAGRFDINLSYPSRFDDFARICRTSAYTAGERSAADGSDLASDSGGLSRD